MAFNQFYFKFFYSVKEINNSALATKHISILVSIFSFLFVFFRMREVLNESLHLFFKVQLTCVSIKFTFCEKNDYWMTQEKEIEMFFPHSMSIYYSLYFLYKAKTCFRDYYSWLFLFPWVLHKDEKAIIEEDNTSAIRHRS